jgi:hypothetical protein
MGTTPNNPFQWLPPMTALQRKFIARIRAQLVPLYKSSSDRDHFILVFQNEITDYINTISEDAYLSALVREYALQSALKSAQALLLQRLEKVREHWQNQQIAGLEFGQPYIPVTDFVNDPRPLAMIKFLVKAHTAFYFGDLLHDLETARKRGGLREREETVILARIGHTPQPREVVTETGFKSKLTPAQLEPFFSRLKKRRYLHAQTSFAQFSRLFEGSSIQEPVHWTGSATQLLFVVDILIETGLVDFPPAPEGNEQQLIQWRKEMSGEQYRLICLCFCDRHGKKYTPNTLKHTRNQLSNKSESGIPARGEELRMLIQELVKTGG